MITMGNTSVAEVYKFIKQFHFEEGFGRNPWDELTFSDSDLIRLVPSDYTIKLKQQSTGKVSSSTDIWFRTWTTNPTACRKLLMLETYPKVQPENTSVFVRLYDGTDDLYWDGAAWSIAGVGDWNTEAEINANIETYPILPGREFAVTVNLRSSDPRLEVSPTVSEIRVLMEVHIDYMEDIIFRSLMPQLEGGLTATSNFAAIREFDTDVSEIDFSLYRKNIPYNITDVERVYDLDDDIDLLYNLRSSYDSNTEIISLSSDLPSGHRPLVVFRYQPETIYITHQDWMEVSKLPAIVIQRLEVPVAKAYNLTAREGVVDKGTGIAVIIPEPWRVTLQFRIHGLTASSVDEMRLMTKTLEFFESNEFVTSAGLDEKYRMQIQKEFRDLSNPDRSDQRAFWTQFEVMDVRMPFVSETGYAVTKLSMDFSEPVAPSEDPVIGGDIEPPNIHIDGGVKLWVKNLELEIT